MNKLTTDTRKPFAILHFWDELPLSFFYKNQGCIISPLCKTPVTGKWPGKYNQEIKKHEFS